MLLVNNQAIAMTAWGIFFFEGGNKQDPLSHNIRNNNPGNLRPFNSTQPHDDSNYRVFPFASMGWASLELDIRSKVTIHLTPDKTMVDFFNIYAPGADHNDPKGYAQFVCDWLTKALKKPVTLTSTIGDIYLIAPASTITGPPSV